MLEVTGHLMMHIQCYVAAGKLLSFHTFVGQLVIIVFGSSARVTSASQDRVVCCILISVRSRYNS
jgi:microcompartment protein CcmK/EutM